MLLRVVILVAVFERLNLVGAGRIMDVAEQTGCAFESCGRLFSCGHRATFAQLVYAAAHSFGWCAPAGVRHNRMAPLNDRRSWPLSCLLGSRGLRAVGFRPTISHNNFGFTRFVSVLAVLS